MNSLQIQEDITDDGHASHMRKSAVIGAGPHGKVVLETLRAAGHKCVEFFDDNCSLHGTTVGGSYVLGSIGDLINMRRTFRQVFVAIGANQTRRSIAIGLRGKDLVLSNAIHPSAVVMQSVQLASGIFVGAGAVIIAGTIVEDDVIINTTASVDHDSRLMAGAYLSPGVKTAGCVTIGREAFIGVGAVLGPGVDIGERAIVGAGSLVLSEIPPDVVAFGQPACVVAPVSPSVDWERILGGKQRRRR